METCKLIVEIAQGFSIIFAALVAIYGIDSWRREFQGKRQIELAEETLALFYEATDAIKSIRSPFGYEGEGKTRESKTGETPEQKHARDKAYVFYERYLRHKELFGKFYAARVRWMANFGKEAAQPFDEIAKILKEVLNASQMLAGLWEDAARTAKFRHVSTPGDVEDTIRKFEAIVWYSGDDDKIEQRLSAALNQMENQCRAIIEARGTIYGFLNWVLPFKRKKQLPEADKKAIEKKAE